MLGKVEGKAWIQEVTCPMIQVGDCEAADGEGGPISAENLPPRFSSSSDFSVQITLSIGGSNTLPLFGKQLRPLDRSCYMG